MSYAVLPDRPLEPRHLVGLLYLKRLCLYFSKWHPKTQGCPSHQVAAQTDKQASKKKNGVRQTSLEIGALAIPSHSMKLLGKAAPADVTIAGSPVAQCSSLP